VSSTGPCPYSAKLKKDRLIDCLQGLFKKWNPDVKLNEVNIDWNGFADSTVTLAENLEIFEKEYPAFRWREPEESEEERMREATLEDVRESVEAALNAGYRPTDIAKMVREALEEQGVTERTIERTLSALNLPTGQPPQPAQAPPPPPPAPPPAQPPAFTPPRREVTEEDVLHAQSALEGWLWRSLRNEEYQRFEAECVARSKTVDELMDCAWRLYEEFSKRPIQLSATKTQQAQPTQPQERARPPTRVTDRRGMTLPVAGSRKGLPINLGGGKVNIPLKGGGKAEIPIAPHRERVTGPPGWFPYVVVTCRRDGRVDVFRARTADQAEETAAAFNNGGKVLCYGLEDECREWIEKYESGEEVNECVEFWAGYYGP